MEYAKKSVFFVGALLATIGFALLTPWPAYALAPAILAPFSIMFLVGTGVAAALMPPGFPRQATQTAVITLSGVLVGSLILLTIYRAG